MIDSFKKARGPDADKLRQSVRVDLCWFVKGILPGCKYRSDRQDAAVDLVQCQAVSPASEMA